MFRVAKLPRSRHTCVRLVLLILLTTGGCSLAYYWRSRSTKQFNIQVDVRSKHRNEVPWERSVAFMSHNKDDDDYDDTVDGLVEDEAAQQTTIVFDIEGRLAKNALEFTDEIQTLGFQTDEEEHLPIGVERKEIQPWELDVSDLEDLGKDYDSSLIEDDHIPGLVDDTKHKIPGTEPENGHRNKLQREDRKEVLLEEELEAVARLAEEEAMRDAEEQEWEKLGDVQEAKEWNKEADVDWDEDEEEIEEEMDEEEARQMQDEGKEKNKEDKESISVTDGSATTSYQTIMEMSTVFATTPEPAEIIAKEEAEENALFAAPEVRKIERMLLKVGLGKNKRFKNALEAQANKKNEIILTLSDSRYTMMVLNFYETTVLQNGISNVLFASLDGRLCSKLDTLHIPCFIYARESITQDDIDRGIHKIFNRKIYYRARMILEALAMGYTVLYSDVDTAFLRKPFPELKEICGDCDVAFQQYSQDSRKLSWGVNYARPTISSFYLYYVLVRKGYNTSMSLPDNFINRLDRQEKLKLVRLPHKKFRPGIDYFKTTKFAWASNCSGCISIHNDEMFSKEAKIYRFKELLLWNLNIDGYYSDTSRKYILYDNPYLFHNGTETLIMELRALRNALALGQILRRIVILPRFHCFVPPPLEGEPALPPPSTKWCNIHDVFRIEAFHRWFMGRYREHAFLSHPKVRDVVKHNISEIYYIGQKLPQEFGPDGEVTVAANVTLVKPKQPLFGAQSEEIRLLFQDEPAAVLHFHSLYYGFSHFLSDEVARGFNRRIKLGFDFRRRVRYNVRRLKVKRPEKPGMPPTGQNTQSGLYTNNEKLHQHPDHIAFVHDVHDNFEAEQDIDHQVVVTTEDDNEYDPDVQHDELHEDSVMHDISEDGRALHEDIHDVIPHTQEDHIHKHKGQNKHGAHLHKENHHVTEEPDRDSLIMDQISSEDDIHEFLQDDLMSDDR